MKPRLIVIDGKMYNSIDEMPQDVRSRYEQALRTFQDQDGNRVLDVLEDNARPADTKRDGNLYISEDIAGASLVNSILKVLVDGKEYNSLDDLPPDARAKYDQAMGALDSNRNGIPDFVEGMTVKKQESTLAASLQNDFPSLFHTYPCKPALSKHRTHPMDGCSSCLEQCCYSSAQLPYLVCGISSCVDQNFSSGLTRLGFD